MGINYCIFLSLISLKMALLDHIVISKHHLQNSSTNLTAIKNSSLTLTPNLMILAIKI